MSTTDTFTVIAEIPEDQEHFTKGTWALAHSANMAHRGPTVHSVAHAPASYAMTLVQAMDCAEHAARFWNASNVTITKVSKP
jgi:hypothetical protein